jgi:hypothetical protein
VTTWARLRTTLGEGRELRIPRCCRLRFAIEEAIRWDPEQALERGIRYTRNGIEYVPCRIFHEATLTHREHEHHINVRAFVGAS